MNDPSSDHCPLTTDNYKKIAKTLSEKFPRAHLGELSNGLRESSSGSEKLLGMIKEAGLLDRLTGVAPGKMSDVLLDILLTWTTEFYPKLEEPDVETLREAADGGDIEAMMKLAKAYEYGMNGLPQSNEQARHFFQMAFEHGKEDAEVFVKQMDEEARGDPELFPLTWDNKRLIARRLQKLTPRKDAIYLSDEYVLGKMKDAGLPKTITDNVPENSELALFGVKYAWAKHAQYECGEEEKNV